jgi:hypothetical protein
MARVKVNRLVCPNCGAAVAREVGDPDVRCAYCHAELRISEGELATTGAAKSARSNVALVLVLSAGALLLIGAILVGAMLLRAATAIAPAVRAVSSAASMQRSEGDKRLFFFPWSPLQVVSIGGSEAVIGLFRALDDGDRLLFVAIDPATGKERWRVTELGTYGDGHQCTFGAVAGQRLAVSDYRSTLHIIEVQSGKELSKVSLTDKVTAMCALPSGNRVILSQVDDKALYVDLTSGRTEAAKEFRACYEIDPVTGAVRGASGPGADLGPMPVAVPGFELKRNLWDKDIAVASGVSSPGTAYPMAQGYNPKTRAVAWTQPVYNVDKGSVRPDSNRYDALRNGVFVTTYGVGSSEWHLTAFAAASGHRLWDTELSKLDALSDPGGITLSSTRAYLARADSLEWYSLKTGKLEGAFAGRK